MVNSMTRATPKADSADFNLRTAEFAALNSAKTQTIHKHYCQKGSYYGVRPQKLPSGRLLWPAIRVTLPA